MTTETESLVRGFFLRGFSPLPFFTGVFLSVRLSFFLPASPFPLRLEKKALGAGAFDERPRRRRSRLTSRHQALSFSERVGFYFALLLPLFSSSLPKPRRRLLRFAHFRPPTLPMCYGFNFFPIRFSQGSLVVSVCVGAINFLLSFLGIHLLFRVTLNVCLRLSLCILSLVILCVLLFPVSCPFPPSFSIPMCRPSGCARYALALSQSVSLIFVRSFVPSLVWHSHFDRLITEATFSVVSQKVSLRHGFRFV